MGNKILFLMSHLRRKLNIGPSIREFVVELYPDRSEVLRHKFGLYPTTVLWTAEEESELLSGRYQYCVKLATKEVRFADVLRSKKKPPTA